MNAARLARHLEHDGVDPALARSLSEHLTDEIEQTVATRDHVELVVTREVQSLRVEMTREIHGLRDDMTREVQGVRDDMTRELHGLRVELNEKLTGQFRWLLGWLAVVTVGILVDLFR